MKRLAIFAMVVIAGLGAGWAWSVYSPPSAQAPNHSIEPLAPATFHYVNMEGAAESAFKGAAEWYGLPAPDRYNRDESEGAQCPSHVPARKGQLFWCQALLNGVLVAVEMELSSSLGFFDTVKIGENPALWQQIEAEESEEVWCYHHLASPAC